MLYSGSDNDFRSSGDTGEHCNEAGLNTCNASVELVLFYHDFQGTENNNIPWMHVINLKLADTVYGCTQLTNTGVRPSDAFDSGA